MLLVGGMRPERLQNMLEAGADRAVQAELVKLYYKNSPKKVAALRNATAAELVLFFREEANREEEQERLQAQMPN
jgi:thiamine monophosphate synthase